MTLFSDLPVIAMSEHACHPKTCLQGVHLKAAAPFVGPDLKVDANNCIVCAVQIYRACTKDLHKVRKCLFIAYKPGHTEEIRPTSISSWIAKALGHAYDNFLRTEHVCLEFEPTMCRPLLLVGMPCRGSLYRTSYERHSGISIQPSLHFTLRTSQ